MDSGLANAYYIIGIICMSLITLILIGLIIAAMKIAAKINHIHRMIEEKVHPARDFVDVAEHLARKVKEKFGK